MLPDYTEFKKLDVSTDAQNCPIFEDKMIMWWKLIHERHNIWYKRFVLNKEAPWTDDPILLKHRFTNTYRELDKGSIYLQDKILSKLDTAPTTPNVLVKVEKMVIFNILAYRYLNKWEAWEKCVDFIWDWKEQRQSFCDKLNHMKEVEKNSVFTAAHMLPPLSNVPGRTKVDRLAVLLDRAHDRLDDIYQTCKETDTLEDIFNTLNIMPWFGRFLSYEMAIDIGYTNITPATEESWVNPGPGCRRGLKWLFDGPWNRREVRNDDVFISLYQDLIYRLHNEQFEWWKKLDLNFPDIAYQGRYLTLRNIEHMLCEGDKYIRTVEGKGHPKQNFTPTSTGELVVRLIGGSKSVDWSSHL